MRRTTAPNRLFCLAAAAIGACWLGCALAPFPPHSFDPYGGYLLVELIALDCLFLALGCLGFFLVRRRQLNCEMAAIAAAQPFAHLIGILSPPPGPVAVSGVFFVLLALLGMFSYSSSNRC